MAESDSDSVGSGGESGLRNEWDEYAAGWDQDEAAQAYAQAAFDSLETVLADQDGSLVRARVCDFGCGTGLLTERFAAVVERVDAVDTSVAMLDVLRSKAQRHGWTNVQPVTSVNSLGVDLDLVVCSSVCAFLEDYPATVERLISHLRPGGLFVQWDWERDENDPDPPGLSRDTVREVLTSAGLTSVTVASGFDISVGEDNMSPLMGIGRRPDIPPTPHGSVAVAQSGSAVSKGE